ncbi:Protein C44C10.9 e [Aphelenchoides avenae]|nr:Protein C44C10.9 e [Aphelenchus avenae]
MPKPLRIEMHDANDFSGLVPPEPIEMTPPPPLKAQHAFYRPFVADTLEEMDLAPPQRSQLSVGDTAHLSVAKQPAYTSIEIPKPQTAQFMYTRPGFDNVPSY